MAATSVLRVYVTVPQAFSSLVKAGEQAELTVNEFPGQTFPAHVVSTAGAINPTSKRLLTELEASNPTGAPLGGAYVQTTLDIPVDGRGVMIPAHDFAVRIRATRRCPGRSTAKLRFVR